jgi:hypothetical protein
MKNLRYAIFTMVALATEAWAGQAGAASLPKPECREYPGYTVISRGRDGETGNDIIVRAKAKPTSKTSCKFAPTATDYVLGKGMSADVLLMHDRFLVLDEGTGPDRTLLIVDVKVKKTLVTSPYAEHGPLDGRKDGFVYWVVDTEPVKPGACPAAWRLNPENAQAKAAHIIRQTLFAFADATPHTLAGVECTQTQNDM